MLRGSLFEKTPFSKSNASLVCVTRCDQRLLVAVRGAILRIPQFVFELRYGSLGTLGPEPAGDNCKSDNTSTRPSDNCTR